MPAEKNILILTSKTGGGHISLAEALRDLLEQDGEQPGERKHTYNITIIDPQPGFFHWHYRLVSRYALWLWAAEFQFLDTPGRARLAHRSFTRLVQRQLHTLLDETRPDVILTTYPFLSYEVMRVQAQRSSAIPLVMLFSDANGVHNAWLTERQAAATLATTRETYEQALAAGFAPERLHLVGWPVRAQFTCAQLNAEKRAELLTHLNLDPNRFTVFLQGGGEGAARFARTIENVLAAGAATGTTSAGSGLQVILATGTNRALLERYKDTPHLSAAAVHQRNRALHGSRRCRHGQGWPQHAFRVDDAGQTLYRHRLHPRSGAGEPAVYPASRPRLGCPATARATFPAHRPHPRPRTTSRHDR